MTGEIMEVLCMSPKLCLELRLRVTIKDLRTPREKQTKGTPSLWTGPMASMTKGGLSGLSHTECLKVTLLQEEEHRRGGRVRRGQFQTQRCLLPAACVQQVAPPQSTAREQPSLLMLASLLSSTSSRSSVSICGLHFLGVYTFRECFILTQGAGGEYG